MSEEGFDYPRILQRALRSVVREVLTRTAAEGLPGEHHFYVSLRTDHTGVELPAFLRERYPQEMTVVLQNQFWDLQVDEQGFAVTLRFDGDPVRLAAPFEAVVAFFDPAAQFGLRFDLAGLGGAAVPPETLAGGGRGGEAGEPAAAGPVAAPPPDEAAEQERPAGDAKVLSFDRARDRREPE
jgi:hypothetical protein